MTPLLGISAWSGTGKTTLLQQLIPLLKQQGIRVGVIKHTHHSVDLDKPGKDSYRLREAGATPVMLASSSRWALMVETPENNDCDLTTLVQQMESFSLDLVLVEGFKGETIPKIALWREELPHPPESLLDNQVIALACDKPLELSVPCLDLNNHLSITEFIVDWLRNR